LAREFARKRKLFERVYHRPWERLPRSVYSGPTWWQN
jgi:hypothetical protein